MILRSIAAFLLVLFSSARGEVSKSVVLPLDFWEPTNVACIDKEGGVVVSTDSKVFYKSIDGPVITRARVGQSIAIPDNLIGSVQILDFPSDNRALRAVFAGKIAFLARVSGTANPESIQSNAIICSDESGLRVVARVGDLLPGTNEPISSVNYNVRFDPAGNIIFLAQGANSSSPRLLKWSSQGLEFVPLDPGFSAGSYVSYCFVSNTGEIVGSGRFSTSHGVNAVPGLGRISSGASRLIYKQGDPVPGMPLEIFNSQPDLFSCNADGDVLFHADTYRQAGAGVRGGLWLARSSGAIDLLAAGSHPTNAVVNASGDVAYLDFGLYLKRAGQETKTIVKPVPQPQYGSLKGHLAMDAAGNVVFQSAGGIWAHTVDDQVLPVAKWGEVVRHAGQDYKISALDLVNSDSGGEEGRLSMLNDWGQIVFVAQLSRQTKPGVLATVSVVMMATLPGGGSPARKPVAYADTAYFQSGIGTAAKVDVLANDLNPVGGRLAIDSVTQGAFGKVSIRNGFVYYTPGEDFLTEDSFQYVASNQWGTTQAATVSVRNPYLFAAGSYATEVFSGPTSIVGTAKITLSKSGRVTGRVQFGGQPFKLNGVFHDGKFVQSFELPGGYSTTVFLSLDTSLGNPARLSGEIGFSFAATNLEIKSVARFGLPADTQAMKVTGVLRAVQDPSLPKQIGYLAGSLSSRGRLVASGRLPDNQPFAASGNMTVDGFVTIDSTPYGKGRGRLYGMFAQVDNGRWDAALNWTRTLPFFGESHDTLACTIGEYAPTPGMPAVSKNGTLAVGTISVEMGTKLTETLSWSQRDVVVFTPPNLNRLQLRVNRGTGIVSGSCIDSDQQLRRMSGVIFAPGNGAVGIVTGGESAGAFTIFAN